MLPWPTSSCVAEVSEADVGVADIAGPTFPLPTLNPRLSDLGVVDEAGDRSTGYPPPGEIGRHRFLRAHRTDKAGDSVTGKLNPPPAEVLTPEIPELPEVRLKKLNRRCLTPDTVPVPALKNPDDGWSTAPNPGAAGISMSGIGVMITAMVDQRAGPATQVDADIGKRHRDVRETECIGVWRH